MANNNPANFNAHPLVADAFLLLQAQEHAA